MMNDEKQTLSSSVINGLSPFVKPLVLEKRFQVARQEEDQAHLLYGSFSFQKIHHRAGRNTRRLRSRVTESARRD
jgi:hypothetical protein